MSPREEDGIEVGPQGEVVNQPILVEQGCEKKGESTGAGRSLSPPFPLSTRVLRTQRGTVE